MLNYGGAIEHGMVWFLAQLANTALGLGTQRASVGIVAAMFSVVGAVARQAHTAFCVSLKTKAFAHFLDIWGVRHISMSNIAFEFSIFFSK